MLKQLFLTTLVLVALAQIDPPPAMMTKSSMSMPSMTMGSMDSMPSMAMPMMTDSGMRMPSPSPSSSDPSMPPSASIMMDTSTSDKASISSSSSSAPKMAMMSTSDKSSPAGMTSASYYSSSSSSGANLFYNTNNAWTYIQSIGGVCCNNCSKICGFGIKIYGTNYYLTNRGSYFTFEYTTNPTYNQLFTIGQNSDCTWYISNQGRYLSTYSPYGAYVGLSSSNSVGQAERWYIERSNGYVVVQSAYSIYNYWRHACCSPFYLGYTYGYSSRFTFEYLPCDKTYGWNW